MANLPSQAERSAALGEIIDAWTEVEEAVFRIFSLILRRPDQEGCIPFRSATT
jgi:hypothetical protein